MSDTPQAWLSGWGNFPAPVECAIGDVMPAAGPCIARGAGRAYGDAAIQPAMTVLNDTRSHFLAFDTTRGILHAQAGVTLRSVLNLTVPKGWLPQVLPGSCDVTLGGALAANVHGKNGRTVAEFSAGVISAGLKLADGTHLTIRPGDDAFTATAGGMGLSGIITGITLQLVRIPSAQMEVQYRATTSIDDMLNGLQNSIEPYAVGWIDHFAGERGILQQAHHALADNSLPGFALTPPRITVPLHARAVQAPLMRLYNLQRYKRHARLSERREPLGQFFFPLDGLGAWNRLYGKKGFVQYQCILPHSAELAAQLRHILTTLKAAGHTSYLAVVKAHSDGALPLSFVREGISLALDLPVKHCLLACLTGLDAWLASIGGRIYLAKDARLAAGDFHRMYGEGFTRWKTMIEKLDPEKRFTSAMSARLEMK